MNSISIKGMSCEHCKRAVTEALEEIGLKDVNVDITKGTATFAESDTDMQILRKAIDEAGFEME